MRSQKTTVRRSRSSEDADLPEIKPVSQVANPRSAVIYGLPGTGKTTLFASWPPPVLIMDMNDRGTDSVSDMRDVDVAKITTPAQIDAVYWKLKRGGWKYKSVGVDTATQMQQLYIEDVTGDRDGGRWGSMTKKQFGDVAALMKSTITNFRDLDLHIAFLAQQRVFNIPEDADSAEEDDEGLSPEIGPALMPSIANHLNAQVAIICQTFIRNHRTSKKIGTRIIKRNAMEYCLYIGPNSIRVTKIRKPKRVVLPSFLVNPTYKDLMKIIEGDKR